MYHCLSHMNGLLLILLINSIVIPFPLTEFLDQELTVGVWFICSSKDTTNGGQLSCQCLLPNTMIHTVCIRSLLN